jgi:hypothetical protein
MDHPLAVGAGILVLTLLSFFQFPGHTYLESDTEIYVPMLEHIWDSSALSKDLVATTPHLSFTLYDEIAIALRWISGSSFHAVLSAQQFIFRALQILGVYLLALSFPLDRRMAMLVAALFTLGAFITGPAVMVFEYEPVPRGFAVALVFLAIGLAAQNHLMWADIMAALAFLYHPPTVLVFWALYLWLVLRHRDYRDLWPLAIGIALLLIAAHFQPGAVEKQVFFSRVGPELERLQRMRASYNWLSMWSRQVLWQYPLLCIVSLVAFWRVQPKNARLFLIGLPLLCTLTMPLSYLLLEQLKWGLIPQIQPARAVMFTTALAVILGAAAGIRAKHWLESFAWFALVFVMPAGSPVFDLKLRQYLLVLGLAAALTLVLSLRQPILLAGIAVTPFFLLSSLPTRNLAGIQGVEQFARSSTPKDAVFVFSDAKKGSFPCIFRAEALRAVYVDWKSGGQINFSETLGMEWWRRWRQTRELSGFDPSLGSAADYAVLETRHRLPDRRPVYENSDFIVYNLHTQY